MLTFRRATELDATIIALLGRVTFSESHKDIVDDKVEFLAYLNKSFTIEKIKSELKDAKNFFWIAFFNDFPVGYAKLVINSPSEFIDSDNVARFERVYVLNDFLHLKVGRQLQDLVFKKATVLKFDWIWLTVSVINFRAINFYQKNNYQDVGLIDFSIGNRKYDNTVFAKKLTE